MQFSRQYVPTPALSDSPDLQRSGDIAERIGAFCNEIDALLARAPRELHQAMLEFIGCYATSLRNDAWLALYEADHALLEDTLSEMDDLLEDTSNRFAPQGA